jgi:hypothetical protein
MNFGKWYIEIFDNASTKYGGHWQPLAKWARLDYLSIAIMQPFCFGYSHDWYDGQHHTIAIGWLRIGWGGRPLTDIPEGI